MTNGYIQQMHSYLRVRVSDDDDDGRGDDGDDGDDTNRRDTSRNSNRC